MSARLMVTSGGPSPWHSKGRAGGVFDWERVNDPGGHVACCFFFSRLHGVGGRRIFPRVGMGIGSGWTMRRVEQRGRPCRASFFLLGHGRRSHRLTRSHALCCVGHPSRAMYLSCFHGPFSFFSLVSILFPCLRRWVLDGWWCMPRPMTQTQTHTNTCVSCVDGGAHERQRRWRRRGDARGRRLCAPRGPRRCRMDDVDAKRTPKRRGLARRST